jgi:Fe2+ transport system protein FeoA
MRCQLCGFEFDERELTCHASCTFNKYCTIICCPNCGHQSVDESKSVLAQAFRRLFGKENPGPGQARHLSDLRPGQSATVESIEECSPSRMEKLSVFGVMPGCPVTLVQRDPAFVVRVGFTELSFEREIAEQIRVSD